MKNMKIIATVGYSQAECKFGMDEGEVLGQYLEILFRHLVGHDDTVTLKRVFEEDKDE